MTAESKIKSIFFSTISVFSFFGRLLPHAPNFAPIGGLAIIAGTYLPQKYALLVPLVVMLASDYFIGFYDLKIMLFVYFSFLIYVFLGNFAKKGKKVWKLLSAAASGALLFFLITNFAVWAFSSLYPKDLSGLLMSYTLALPFLKNTLIGDLFYSTVFFAAYEFAFKKVLLRQQVFSSKTAILINT